MKRKLYSVLLTLALSLAVVFGLAACTGKYKMKDFVADFSDFKKTYEVGDEIDLSKVKIYATFSDDSKENIPFEKVTITIDGSQVTLDNINKATESVGEKVIEIKYSNIVRSVTIKVVEKHVKVLSGVRFDATNVVKTYVYGDQVSLQGLKVYALYGEDGEEEITLNDSDLQILMGEVNITSSLNKITETLGQKAIKVRYKTVISTESFIINVTDEAESVSISIPQNFKTTYKVGDEVSFTGITAKALFKSGAEENVSDIKFYLGEALIDLSTISNTKGTKNITVKAVFGSLTKTETIALTFENYVESISLDTQDINLEFIMDDEVSIDNFKEIKVNVVYKDTQDNKTIKLNAEGVESLNAQGAAIDYSNITKTAGTKTITVKYENKTTTFNVVVLEKDSALKSLTIKSNPTTSTYVAGSENVSFAGLVITLSYKDELARADEDIAFADFTDNDVELYFNDSLLTNINNVTKVNTLGANTVQVSVKVMGKTANFNLTINNAVVSIAVDETSIEKNYKIGDTVDFSNIKVTATLNHGTLVLAYADLKFFDGETEVTSSLNSLTGAEAQAKVVTVKYNEVATSFNIKVEDFVTGIETGTTKTFSCDVDTTIGAKKTSFEGLEVYKVFKSGKKELLSTGYTFSNNSIEIPETKNVTITFETFTTTISLTINDILESIEVVETSIPTKIVKNGTVDLTGLKVNGTFKYAGTLEVNLLQEDGESFIYGVVQFSLKVSGVYQVLTQLELDTIANESGEREVKLTYTYNSKAVSDEFIIDVLVSGNGVDGFEKPSSLTNFNSTLENGRLNDDESDAGFEGALYVSENEDYLVGDENNYKFLPKLTQIDIFNQTKTVLKSFTTSTTLKWINEENSNQVVTLVQKPFDSQTRVYSSEINGIERIFAYEYYKTNEFKFEDFAVGKKIIISVLPSENDFVYDLNDVNAVEWTVRIVKGFNIHDVRELCVLEQNSTRHDWDSIKAELGLTNCRPSAIILHDDMKVTKDSLPSSMTFTLDDNYQIFYQHDDYNNKNPFTPEQAKDIIGVELSRTFIYNELNNSQEYGIFRYDMNDNESFAIHGNFYSIDLSSLPLVCAFEPTGYAGDLAYYGEYMSKLSFLDIRGVGDATESESEDETFTFENFQVKGNTAPLQVKVDSSTTMKTGEDEPVFGGGIIFVKTNRCHANITNINAHACFISFYSRDYTVVNYTNVKAYDSFLNGLFVNGESTNNLVDCHMKRAGGPLMLLVQTVTGDESTPLIPRVTADDASTFECFVTGGELWFTRNQADVTTLKGFDALLNMNGKTFMKDGKHNLIALSMKLNNEGDITNQALMSYKGTGINKIAGDSEYEYAKIVDNYTHAPVAKFDNLITFLNPGNPSLEYAGIYKFDSSYNMAKINANEIANANYIAIYVFGMGVFTELWDNPTA